MSRTDFLGMTFIALDEKGEALVRYQGRVMTTWEAVKRFSTENHDPGDEHREVVK